jgi:hypothetical protein
MSMKAMILAAVAALSLGVGVASAQGLPAGYAPPGYGSVWAANKLAAEKLNSSNQAQAAQPAAPRAASATTNGG